MSHASTVDSPRIPSKPFTLTVEPQYVIDFRYQDHGSIVLLTAKSSDGKAWAEEHLPEDCARHGQAYAIAPRYFPEIHAGILDADLTITAGY